jgi:hypothetical protein
MTAALLVIAAWVVTTVLMLRGFHVLGQQMREADRRRGDRRG